MKKVRGLSLGTPTQILVDIASTASTEIHAAVGNPDAIPPNSAITSRLNLVCY